MCPIGRYRDNETKVAYECKVCPVDTYNGFDQNATQDKHDELADCVECPIGQLTDGQVESPFCSPCKAGRYTLVESKRCQSCRRGWYQDTAGQLTCKPCAEGQYQNSTSKTSW